MGGSLGFGWDQDARAELQHVTVWHDREATWQQFALQCYQTGNDAIQKGPIDGRQGGVSWVMSCVNVIASYLYSLDYFSCVLLGDFSSCCHTNSPLGQEPGSPRLLFFHPCSACLCHHVLVALQEQSHLRTEPEPYLLCFGLCMEPANSATKACWRCCNAFHLSLSLL